MFKDDKDSMSYLEGEKAQVWKNTEKLSDYSSKVDEFAAIFYVGGHGRKLSSSCPFLSRAQLRIYTAMIDLVDNEVSQKIAAEFFDKGKIVASVCHGTVALSKVKTANGELLIKGQPVSGFSNAEEEQAGYTKDMPFLLEDLIKEQGGKYEMADKPWGEQVSIARGGRLITGQNPASAGPLGEAIKKAITA